MKRYFKAKVAVGLIFAFLLNIFGPAPWAHAETTPIVDGGFALPIPGMMVPLSPAFTPAELKGIIIHPENPLKFDFIVFKGDSLLSLSQKQNEYRNLIKYFLASLAVPDENQWVNLSPYEKDRMIKDDFGKTQMGRDLLAQDYLLKQITASLIYPESRLGAKFWNTVYQRAYKEFGQTQIPVNTFNKVWIVPDEALIYEKRVEPKPGIGKQATGNVMAYVVKNHLKVMLEEDYLSLKQHTAVTVGQSTHTLASQIIRDIILPALEKEVNEGKNFAMLRQVYSGMILAAWYKRVLKESLLGKIYMNKDKVKGIDQNPQNNERIYQRYLQAFKKGVYNYIKEDVDRYTHETIPRKYFSGGLKNDYAMILKTTKNDGIGSEAINREVSEEEIVDAAMANISDQRKPLRVPRKYPENEERGFFEIFRSLQGGTAFMKDLANLHAELIYSWAEMELKMEAPHLVGNEEIELLDKFLKPGKFEFVSKFNEAVSRILEAIEHSPYENEYTLNMPLQYQLIRAINKLKEHQLNVDDLREKFIKIFYPQEELPSQSRQYLRLPYLSNTYSVQLEKLMKSKIPIVVMGLVRQGIQFAQAYDYKSTTVQVGGFDIEIADPGLNPHVVDVNLHRDAAMSERITHSFIVDAAMATLQVEEDKNGSFKPQNYSSDAKYSFSDLMQALPKSVTSLEQELALAYVRSLFLGSIYKAGQQVKFDTQTVDTVVDFLDAHENSSIYFIDNLETAQEAISTIFRVLQDATKTPKDLMGYRNNSSLKYVLAEDINTLINLVFIEIKRERNRRRSNEENKEELRKRNKKLADKNAELIKTYFDLFYPNIADHDSHALVYLLQTEIIPKELMPQLMNEAVGFARSKRLKNARVRALAILFRDSILGHISGKRVLNERLTNYLENTVKVHLRRGDILEQYEYEEPSPRDLQLRKYLSSRDFHLRHRVPIEPHHTVETILLRINHVLEFKVSPKWKTLSSVQKNDLTAEFAGFDIEKLREDLSRFDAKSTVADVLQILPTLTIRLKGKEPIDSFLDVTEWAEKIRSLHPELTSTLVRRGKQLGADSAMISENPLGGIDMNAAHLNMQIKHDGPGFPLSLKQQDLENLHIDGLVPVILRITPATASPLLSQIVLIDK